MAQVEFTPTTQCPRCGEIYPSARPHTCTRIIQNGTWVTLPKHDIPVVDELGGVKKDLGTILDELRAIRAILEGRR